MFWSAVLGKLPRCTPGGASPVCSRLRHHLSSSPCPSQQEGAVDEVSFRAPELGPLSALLVGPEAGCWVCEEVDVSSSRTGHTDRCVWGATSQLPQ